MPTFSRTQEARDAGHCERGILTADRGYIGANEKSFEKSGIQASVGSSVVLTAKMIRPGIVQSVVARVDESESVTTVEVPAFLTLVQEVPGLWTAGQVKINTVKTLAAIGIANTGKELDSDGDPIPELAEPSAPSEAEEHVRERSSYACLMHALHSTCGGIS